MSTNAKFCNFSSLFCFVKEQVGDEPGKSCIKNFDQPVFQWYSPEFRNSRVVTLSFAAPAPVSKTFRLHFDFNHPQGPENMPLRDRQVQNAL